MEIVFERIALYEQVWSEPLTRLAKKYGLSDNGLRKVCKAMNIPLPQGGHWAKVAAGHQVSKTPLPKRAERTTFVSSPPEPAVSNDEMSKDKAWCKEHESFEALPENRIVVDLNPARWHSAVISLRDRCRQAAGEYEGYRKKAEKAAAKPARKSIRPWVSGAFDEEWQWKAFVRRGSLLFDTHKAAPLKVSILTYERALAILNAFTWEAEKRGFAVNLNEDRGRIQIGGYEASVDIRITERLEERPDETQPPDVRSVFRDTIKVPTGQLRMFVERSGYNSHEVADEPDVPLETRLNAVFIKLYRSVVRAREDGRKWAEWRRQRELEELRQEELEKRHREEARRVDEERKRRAKLEEEASNWQKACLIRDYVEHTLKSVGEPLPTNLADWKNWALDVAFELDPTAARCKGEKDA